MMGFLGKAFQGVQEYFFAPEAPQPLACCRIAFCLWIFLFYLPINESYHAQNVADFALLDKVFWQPVLPFNRLPYDILVGPWLGPLAIAWKCLLFSACIGFFTRFSLVCAALLSFYLIGLPYNFGKISHSGAAVAIGLCILALARSGDAFSVDAWLRRKRGIAAASLSGEYRWPIRFAWTFLATVYLCSAISKLKVAGLGYFAPETMANILLTRSFSWNSPPWTSWGYALSQYPAFCSFLSIATVIGEGGFFFAMFSKRGRMIFVPMLFCFHIAVAALLGPRFFHFMALYVFWVPWQAILEQARMPVARIGSD